MSSVLSPHLFSVFFLFTFSMYQQYQIHAQLMNRCKHKINQSGSRVGVGRVGISLCVIYSLRLQSEPLKYSVMEHGNLCEDKTKKQ